MADASGNFFRRMFNGLIPMRGCLAYGDFYCGPEGELFGPALIEAYEEAEAQDWLGFIIHPTAEERIKLCEKNGRRIYDALQAYDYTEYAVPFKRKAPEDTQESRLSEECRRLAYTVVKPGTTREHVGFVLRDSDHMQGVGESLIQMDKDMTPEEKDRRGQDVRRKHEHTREFIRNTSPAPSDSI
jgi:hypothetical protein